MIVVDFIVLQIFRLSLSVVRKNSRSQKFTRSNDSTGKPYESVANAR